jgi:asparagine synthase (glutamine-hydrolysing)
MSHRLRVALAQKRDPDNSSLGSPGRDVAARSIQVSWEAALETAPHLNPESTFRYEYRYPYFDRDLVDFLCSIPRNQLVRPGRRRYLMREALKMIVPPEILERRRKAYIVRRQAMDFESARCCIGALLTGSLAEHYGFVDGSQCLIAASHMNGASQASLWHQLLRTAMLETWLRAANSCRVLTDSGPDLPRSA